jgi:acylphosphatase
VVVRGRVQGVGFRWFARQAARRLGLAGWVSNRPDGGVEVAAEGEQSSLEVFRGMLGQGPEGAHVISVDDAGPVSGSLERPFTIMK